MRLTSPKAAALLGAALLIPAIATPANAAQPAVKTYTMAQVKAHNSASDCWTVVNKKVYDVTRWVGRHPGGKSAILSLCGKDGSRAFLGQHGGQGEPTSVLKSFKIGTLR